MTSVPAMDVVIVSYNTREDLLACLSSLFAHPPSRLGRVFVVDNASDDESAEAVAERWPQIRTIALTQNVGFAAANNLAIREAESDLVLLLNSDTIVPARALDGLRDRLLATGAVAAGPKLRDASGRPEVSFGPMLTPFGELKQRRLVRRAASDKPGDRKKIRLLLSEEQVVDWASGACLLVRRQEAVDAGLLDERFFMYEEDVDFCAALRARGGKVLFTPSVEVIHHRGRSIRRTRGSSVIYDRSHVAFYEKHAPAWAPLLRLWLKVRGRSIR